MIKCHYCYKCKIILYRIFNKRKYAVKVDFTSENGVSIIKAFVDYEEFDNLADAEVSFDKYIKFYTL